MAPGRLTRSLLLLGALAGGALVLPASSALAQMHPDGPGHERPGGAHIDGHIAFLQAELAITAAQQTLWDNVAAVMRADVNDVDRLRAQFPPPGATPAPAPQLLEMRAAFAALRASSEQRFLGAFRPLYAALSDDQKKTADELFGRHHGAH